MSKNKITRWIDMENQLVCLQISVIYNRLMHTLKPFDLWLLIKIFPLLVIRFLLLIVQFFRFNIALLDPYRRVIRERFDFLRMATGIISTLSGARLFLKLEYTPEFYRNKGVILHFKEVEAPQVTIIIPAQNNTDLTLNTLLALEYNLPQQIPVELILVNSDQEEFKSFKKYKTVSEALINAKGIYVTVLNNGSLIQKGWLENSLEVFNHDSSIDAVGFKILFPNGILKEAGGILLDNGTQASYGQFEHRENHKYNFNRQVDFCSQFLFKNQNISSRALSKIVYASTAELVDFAKVIQNPKINGLTEITEAFAKRNVPHREILVIDANLPFYDKDSGSNRILHLLRIFKELNYHISFLPDNGVATEPYFTLLRNLGIEVLPKYMGSRTWKKELKEHLSQVNICWLSRPELNKKYSFIFDLQSNIKWVYDTVDLHFIRLEREAMLESILEKRTELLHIAEVNKNLEIELSKKADLTIAITEQEARDLLHNQAKSVRVVPNIHIAQKGTSAPFERRHGIMFIGGFYHQPNVDAVLWLANEIMPTVWKFLPEIKLYLVGSNPPANVLSLAQERIVVTGYVKDVSTYFNSCRIFVAPLRYGAGMKGKIGQTLEFALPAVSTAIGTEGMNLKHGMDIIEANTLEEFQQGIIELYTNPELWEKLHKNALAALTPLLFDHQKKNLNQILNDLTCSTYRVTIITVVKNGEKTLQNLIDSIARYKTPEIEFLVWDGRSTDDTLNILKQNRDVVDQFVSLPDDSIYDAMNQALKLAKGKFVHFIGADDILHEGFQRIVPLLKNENTIYYGGVLSEGKRISRPFDAYRLTKQHLCHQAIIYPRSVFGKYTFDTTYNVFADYHLNLKCWTDSSFKKQYADILLAEFSPGGYSDFTQDINYTRHKEAWFKEFLNWKDYFRYLKRKIGYIGLFKEILTGTTPYVLPKKTSSKHTILFVTKKVSSETADDFTLEQKSLIERLNDLNYELSFYASDCHFTHIPQSLLDQSEFVWLQDQTISPNLIKTIKKRRHIKIVLELLEQPDVDQTTIRLSKRVHATLTLNTRSKRILQKNGVNNVYLNSLSELKTLFNNLR